MADAPLHRRAINKAKDIQHHLAVRVVGTKYSEKEWESRGEEGSYWDSRQAPHRDLLAKAILSFSPSSILEVGCNTGPNLFRLAEKLPEAKLVGVNISAAAIARGRSNFHELGMKNVELLEAKADDLSAFEDKSFDVVFADAVLIYIGKDKVEAVVREMMRLAKKAIILLEYNDPSASPEGAFIFEKGYWKRDYVGLFQNRHGVEEVKSTRLSKEIWDDEYWSRLGAIIEVRLAYGDE
jgi:SAM-dependent methyltransferase